jgi:NAD(P) transhydrogenase subunit beta
MPVVISLLNSYSGLAAAATGFVLSNNVLIISGALVGASGLILTNIMCKAMNRSLANVLFAAVGTDSGTGTMSTEQRSSVTEYAAEDAAMVMDTASSVIIVPGYGLAVAQAQHVLHELATILMDRGVTVRYAIHPVAGRMPGHMNVLLAEANVPYDLLLEMDEINDDFQNTDVVLVIGANDVINPAARYKKDSPLYGMPILNVDQAKTVMIVKRSLSAGFAGEDNELFYDKKTMMLFGDAKKMVTELVKEVKEL